MPLPKVRFFAALKPDKLLKRVSFQKKPPTLLSWVSSSLTRLARAVCRATTQFARLCLSLLKQAVRLLSHHPRIAGTAGVLLFVLSVILVARRLDYNPLGRWYKSPLKNAPSLSSFLQNVQPPTAQSSSYKTYQIGPFEVKMATESATKDTLVMQGEDMSMTVTPLDSRTLGKLQKSSLVSTELTGSEQDTAPAIEPPEDASASARASKQASMLRYPNLYAGVSLVYTTSATGMLEEYEVKTKLNVTEFVQELKLENLNIEPTSDHSFVFKNKKTGETAFALPKPVMYEKYAHHNRSYGLHYDIKEQNGSLLLLKVIDEEGLQWLESASYPVMIDGTIVTDKLTLSTQPLALDHWTVNLDTVGTEDLSFTITPQAQLTEAHCGDSPITPVRSDQTYTLSQYSCSQQTRVSFMLPKSGEYTFDISFGGTSKSISVVYDPSSSAPVFGDISQSPIIVKPGDTITVRAHISNVLGITAVSANLGETLPTINLSRISGTDTDGVWEGTWVAEGTGPITYYTTITATNSQGVSATSQPIEWSDWSDLGGGDHGGADWTFTGNTTIAGVHTNIGTITINPGVTVSVEDYNGTSSGTLELQATNIDIQGTLSANGKGYRGGAFTATGEGTGAGVGHSADNGGGGGYGGHGGTASSAGGATYGSLTQPTHLGSGGGGGRLGVGGDGGGAIRMIVSGTVTVGGTLSSNGLAGQTDAADNGGGGSGGSIYVTTGTFTGSGSITASGGLGGNNGEGGGGGGGRIAVEYSGLNTFNGTASVAKANGGSDATNGTAFFIETGNADLTIPCANGTWLKSERASWAFRNLTVNGSITFKSTNAELFTISVSGTTTFASNITVTLGGSYTTNTNGKGVLLDLAGDVTVPANTTISATGQGYLGMKTYLGYGEGPGGGGYTTSAMCIAYSGGGGGYGGAGGGSSGGGTYGSRILPLDLGSGGGNACGSGGDGGGAIKLVTSGTLTVNGSITANGLSSGAEAASGGGSGGSILIITDTLAGNGSITANGNNVPAGWSNGGGGGGRIALYYGQKTASFANLTASAGTGNPGGSAGTVFEGRLYTWDGGGTDETCGGSAGDGNKASCATNWTNNTLPAADDYVIFDATSTKNATIDAAFPSSLTLFEINSGYTGTITQARDFTVTSNFTQADGTFNGSASSLTVQGDLTVSGGVFNQGTKTTDQLANGLVGYWTTDESSGTTMIADSSPTLNHMTSASSTNVATGKIGNARTLDGTNGTCASSTSTYPSVTNTFSFSMWVNPNATRSSTSEANSGVSGTSGQRYVLVLPQGQGTYGAGHSSAGVSVGTNGVSVFEHDSSYNPSLLVYNTTLSGWTHIHVNYNNKTPTLYINGIAVRTGLTSTKTVHPGNGLGNTYGWGSYSGAVDEIRTYNRILNQAEISAMASGNTTLASPSLVVSGSLIQTGGNFNTNNTDLQIDTNLSLNSGTFTPGTSKVHIRGSSSSSLSCNNVSFSGFAITKNVNTAGISIGNTCSLPLGTDPIVVGSLTLNGTLSGSGALTISSGTTSTNTFNASATLSGFSGLNTTGHLTVNGLTLNASSYTTFSSNNLTVSNASLSLPDANTSTVGGNLLLSSGTLTAGSTGALNIAGTYTQNGGTFTGQGGNVDVNSSYSLTSGSFTAPSGNLYVTGSFTVSGGIYTHNSGTVVLDGLYQGDTSVNAPGVDFNVVTVNRNGDAGSANRTLTITNGTTIPLGDNPTLTLNNTNTNDGYYLVNNGTITATGTGTITLNVDGTITNNGTISAGTLTSLVVNGTLINNGTATFTNANSFDFNWYDIGLGSLSNNGTATFTANSTPSFTVNGSFIVSSSTTFPSSGVTLTMDGILAANTSLDAPGVTFSQVTLNRTIDNTSVSPTLTIASGTTVPLGNTPTITLNNTNATSDYYHLANNGTITTGTGTFTINLDGTFTNSSTLSAASISSFVMNGNMVNAGTATFTNCNSFDVNSFGEMAGNLTTNSGSTFASASSPVLSIRGSVSVHASSTFPTSLSSFTLDGTSGTQTVSMPNVTSFGNFAKTGASTFTPGHNMTVENMTFSGGTIGNPASPYTMYASGDVSFSSSGTFGGANLTLNLSGNGVQTINKTAGTFSSPLLINKNSGTVTLSSGVSLGSTCTVREGTLDLAGNNFTCSSTFTVEDGGTLSFRGSESVSLPVLNTGSTVIYTGDTNSTPSTQLLHNWSYQNLNINLQEAQDTATRSDSIGLKAYWPLDEGSGTGITDASGNGLSGTATNATITTGRYSNARNFDGNGDYINIPYNRPKANLQSETITAWVYRNGAGVGNMAGIVNVMGTGDTDNQAGMYTPTTDDDTVACGGSFNSGSGIIGINTDATALPLTQWTHLTCVFSYAGNTMKVSLYKNGTFIDSTEGNITEYYYDSNAIKVGVQKTGFSRYFNGIIDDVRMYNRALTGDEITAIVNDAFSGNAFHSLSVAGNFSISSGTLTAPTTLTIGGNLVNNGTFTHNSGTVVFNDASKPSVLSGSGSPALTFFNLSSTTAGKSLLFTGGETFRVNGLLTLTGASKNWVSLNSTNTSQWVINHQGSESISYATVKNSGCEAGTTDITAGATSRDLGNNGTCWLFSSPPIDVRVGGTMRVKGNTRVGGDQ